MYLGPGNVSLSSPLLCMTFTTSAVIGSFKTGDGGNNCGECVWDTVPPNEIVSLWLVTSEFSSTVLSKFSSKSFDNREILLTEADIRCTSEEVESPLLPKSNSDSDSLTVVLDVTFSLIPGTSSRFDCILGSFLTIWSKSHNLVESRRRPELRRLKNSGIVSGGTISLGDQLLRHLSLNMYESSSWELQIIRDSVFMRGSYMIMWNTWNKRLHDIQQIDLFHQEKSSLSQLEVPNNNGQSRNKKL